MAIVNQIINGGFTDNQGNALSNGFLLFKLNIDCFSTENPTVAICSGSTIKVPLDANGNVPSSPVYSVIANNKTNPSSFYFVEAYTSLGQLVWGPYTQSVLITPSPFDLGVWIPGKLN
jgi:hypothetical protein